MEDREEDITSIFTECPSETPEEEAARNPKRSSKVGRVTGYNMFVKENIDHLPKTKDRFIKAASSAHALWKEMSKEEKGKYTKLAEELTKEMRMNVACEYDQNALKYTCDHCGASYSRHKSLRQHQTECLTTFPCDMCDKVFRQKRNMEAHKQLIHFKVRPFKCTEEDCGKTFRSRAHLSRHMLIHFGDKVFTCETCDKGFFQLSNLKRHEKIHI